MDAKQFDSVARSLAGQASRRVLAGGLATGVLGTALGLLAQPADAAKRKERDDRDNDRVGAEKKKKKKVTLCQNGQTIKVNKKAKKKFLRQGATTGACPDTPACTPNPNACDGRECGSVDNGCGIPVPCGPDNGNCAAALDDCKAAGICGNDGQCSYSNSANDTPCGADKCNQTCQDGVCTNTPVECPAPNKCQVGAGVCEPGTGQCVYTNLPNDTPCGETNDAEYCTRTCQQGACTGTPAPDGTPCGMNKCRNTCEGGLCTQNPVVCSDPLNDCVRDCDPNTGTCLATPESRPNGVSCNGGAGMCVNGTCEETNAGTTTCSGANPCLPATYCNATETCLCYSTIEGAGFCIDQSQAFCPDASVRPACSSSDECGDSSVCVPLRENPNSTTSCCPSGQFPGFCVPLSARCAQA